MSLAVGPIIPHFWLDRDAVEAARFYADIFPDASVDHVGLVRNTPSGDCETVAFSIAGMRFMAIGAGPSFKPNPSISFLVNFDPSRNVGTADLDALWEKLGEGGTVRMELGEYPFSKHYGWVEDRFGVNWQLMLTNPEGDPRPFLVPAFLFVGDVAGRAEEAIDYWTGVFPASKRGLSMHYSDGMEPDRAGELMFGDFQLCGQWFAAMDSRYGHDFGFTEGLSLLVECGSQSEMDGLFDALSAVPEAEQCGWLKDRFGVSWQVTPAALNVMMREGSQEQIDRVTQAFLPMKRLNLAGIEAAYRQSNPEAVEGS